MAARCRRERILPWALEALGWVLEVLEAAQGKLDVISEVKQKVRAMIEEFVRELAPACHPKRGW